MSRLKELIDRLCPNGVEYKKLGEVCNILRGKRLTKTAMIPDGMYPVYHGGLEPLGHYDKSNREANTVMIINVGASAGTVGFCDKAFWSSDGCFCLSHSADVKSKFIYYYLSNGQKDFVSKVRHAGIPTLDAKVIRDYVIPIPPIEVQEEIVKILDRFAEYAAALQAELQARKEQYEYYRNLLLTFNSSACGCGTDDDQEIKVTTWGGYSYDIAWKTMGDICRNMDKMRKPITAAKRKAGSYPYYGASGIVDYVDNYIFDGEYLLISEDGANLKARSMPIAFPISGKCWVNNHAHVLKFENQYTQKFIQYYINMINISKYISGAAQPKLNQENLNSIRVPIPPLELQKKIVAILDRFETLVNDLTQGLPAEIKAVQEQYEYYRNKLLSFPMYKLIA